MSTDQTFPSDSPAVGLGTLLLRENCEAAINDAVQVGCKLIDTGEHYGNLELVGKALRMAPCKPCVLLKISGIPTGEYAAVRARVVGMLEKLGIKRAGLLLIHWPGLCNWDPTDMAPLAAPSTFQEKSDVSTWEVFCQNIQQGWANMKKLKEEGLVLHIGTSNFYAHHLDELAKQCDGAVPFANEIFVDATNHEIEFVKQMQAQGIHVLAYRPIMYKPFPEAVIEIADRHSISPQSVVLGWLLKRGIYPLVKCRGSHIDENLKKPQQIKDLLSAEDLETIESADAGMKLSSEWFAKKWRTHNEIPGAVSEDDVLMLVSMGVEEEKAREVLAKCEGDLDAAMDAAFT
eukprot:gnl/MRDRNA2_/MRDRNA2_95634_c0_seq1.p1 gnl/MRDRNA2_/MRDRNA2_95634_c0~~gnl/MRDRNA2_/MRDRNA2_95634_c0_seq1.p1  ORF type:complete len:374 (+),score=63.77 gnl/MRDRNA2_/MRDRNA2_95634_c0_seq1:87-1124(+)